MFPLTFRHRAGVSPYTSPFGFAETCVFAKQSPGPFICGLHRCRLPFSLSYGVILPSSLTTLLPLALESSSCLPVSVCGTGSEDIHTAFLATVQISFPTMSVPYNRRNHRPAKPFQSVPVLKYFGGYGISTVCASATPFGLTLAPG